MNNSLLYKLNYRIFLKSIKLAQCDYVKYFHKHQDLEEKNRELYKRKKRWSHAEERKYQNNKDVIENFRTAERYLFSRWGLEHHIEFLGMDLNIEMIRKETVERVRR